MKNNKKAFTLIELLVVITIIGILAGLAVPAISSALARAKQTGDVANVRQLGLIVFSIANDENGVYPIGGITATGSRTAASSDVTFFNSMLTSKEIPDPKIVWSTIATPVTPFTFSNPSLVNANIAFDYLQGLTTSDNSLIPIFVSRGAFTNTSGFTNTAVAATNVWGSAGVTSYTVGNSAQWTRATNNALRQPFYSSSDNVTFTSGNATLLQ